MLKLPKIRNLQIYYLYIIFCIKDLISPKKKKSGELENNLTSIRELMLERFVNELLDYEELILILANSEKSKKISSDYL